MIEWDKEPGAFSLEWLVALMPDDIMCWLNLQVGYEVGVFLEREYESRTSIQ